MKNSNLIKVKCCLFGEEIDTVNEGIYAILYFPFIPRVGEMIHLSDNLRDYFISEIEKSDELLQEDSEEGFGCYSRFLEKYGDDLRKLFPNTFYVNEVIHFPCNSDRIENDDVEAFVALIVSEESND